MVNLFAFTGQRVGVNILRSSYLTYQSQLRQAQGKILTVADKKKLATLMRTRKDKIDTHYIKDIPQNEKQELIENIPKPDTNPLVSPYQKQLNNSKSYYQKQRKYNT